MIEREYGWIALLNNSTKKIFAFRRNHMKHCRQRTSTVTKYRHLKHNRLKPYAYDFNHIAKFYRLERDSSITTIQWGISATI